MVSASAPFRVSIGRPGTNRLEWAWTESLATARPGTSYRVARIPLTIARERCQKLGCAEGEVVTCTGNSGGMVALERADGRKLLLERMIAWYVHAEICGVGGPRPN